MYQVQALFHGIGPLGLGVDGVELSLSLLFPDNAGIRGFTRVTHEAVQGGPGEQARQAGGPDKSPQGALLRGLLLEEEVQLVLLLLLLVPAFQRELHCQPLPRLYVCFMLRHQRLGSH